MEMPLSFHRFMESFSFSFVSRYPRHVVCYGSRSVTFYPAFLFTDKERDQVNESSLAHNVLSYFLTNKKQIQTFSFNNKPFSLNIVFT